jgi:hypothetical protein
LEEPARAGLGRCEWHPRERGPRGHRLDDGKHRRPEHVRHVAHVLERGGIGHHHDAEYVHAEHVERADGRPGAR